MTHLAIIQAVLAGLAPAVLVMLVLGALGCAMLVLVLLLARLGPANVGYVGRWCPGLLPPTDVRVAPASLGRHSQ